MGGAQSSNSSATEEDGVSKDLESKLRGNGDLDILERAFSHLTASSSSSEKHSIPLPSLQAFLGLAPISIDETAYPELSKVVSQIGPAIVDEFFVASEKQEITWVHFLEGFQNCSQTFGGNRLKQVLSVYCRALENAKGSSNSSSKKASGASGTYLDHVGYLTGAQLQDFLWLCWLLMCHARLPSNTNSSKLQAFLPKIGALLSGALSVCAITKVEDDFSGQNDLEKELPLGEILSWVLSMIAGLGDCMVHYLRAHLGRVSMHATDLTQDKESSTFSSEHSGTEHPNRSDGKTEETQEAVKEDSLLLQPGIAWALGLSLRDSTASEILFRASCGLIKSPESEYPNLLYRSAIHGRGMNRFWTSVQGYRGLTLFLISAHATEEGSGHKVCLGGLIPGGFDNKESFYGASGACLFSLDPAFLPIRSTGREKNFVYSHKHTPGAGYRAQSKAEGIGFGGDYNKERVWLNEEMTTLTLRHHAVDKTYQPGPLVPNQGYAPVVANVSVVEVWGLGGRSANQDQAAFLNRENLFSEQRRKVDLKTMFGAWENSPEKIMMEMVSDPNAPGREER